MAENDVDAYEIRNGTIRFPLSAPVPSTLIARIVALRVQALARAT